MAASFGEGGHVASRHTVPSCSLAPKKRGGSVLNAADANDVSAFISAFMNEIDEWKVAPLKMALAENTTLSKTVLPQDAFSKSAVSEKVAPSNQTVPENLTSLNKATFEKIAPLKRAPL